MSSVFPLRICAARRSASGRVERAASDQVVDRVMAAGELANGERRRGAHDRRNDRRQAASVRELRVEQWVVLVELFAELIGDHFEAGAQSAGVEGDGRLPGERFRRVRTTTRRRDCP